LFGLFLSKHYNYLTILGIHGAADNFSIHLVYLHLIKCLDIGPNSIAPNRNTKKNKRYLINYRNAWRWFNKSTFYQINLSFIDKFLLKTKNNTTKHKAKKGLKPFGILRILDFEPLWINWNPIM
jgi:hypothetical protein